MSKRKKPRTWYGWRCYDDYGIARVRHAKRGISVADLRRGRFPHEHCVRITEILPKPRKPR